MIIMYNIFLITIIRFATVISQKYLSYANPNPFWYVVTCILEINFRKKKELKMIW